MEELFKLLGLDPDAPTAKAIEAIKDLQEKISDKNAIIEGLSNQLEENQKRFDKIAQGVAESRVRDLVQKVQNETGYHVGGEKNMQILNRKAAKYIYASDDEQEDIWNDMKAQCLAYGTKVGLDDKISALAGDREDEDDVSPIYRRARELKESGKAKTWSEAHEMVREEMRKNKNEE